MRIILTLPEGDALTLTEWEATVFMRDALAEFVSHRGPTPEAYVARRYPENEGYGWLDRDRKVEAVRTRCRWATAFHGATVEVEHG